MGEQITYSQSEAVEENTSGHQLSYFGKDAFDVLLQANNLEIAARTQLFAQMARYNTLYMIAKAGSGHLGSSFSSLDIVSWLYLNCMTDSDRYYSSKGHDAPGLYSVLTALGILPFEKIHQLRRLAGLPGHPVVEVPGMVTNTGSLGMGVSKAKGFIAADRLLKRTSGRIFVMTGDGELQEGQFWESLMSARRLCGNRLVVIVDHNKIQSDTFVSDVSDLGDLTAKFAAFDFEVLRCDGHDFNALDKCLSVTPAGDRPVALIADTVKGAGISFMAHTSMEAGEVYYRYHSGAPSPDEYKLAIDELQSVIIRGFTHAGLSVPVPHSSDIDPIRLPKNVEKMIPAYTGSIIRQADLNEAVVALDADLVLDTGLIPFKEKYPNRFFECGISEQDMVSQAGTMALGGLLPVVHSFACFLSTRPTEQIYNNFTEHTKVVYVGSLAGLLPAGPGHSHQSVRDICTMSGMPGFAVLEPFSAAQIEPLMDWVLNSHNGSSYIRLTSIPYSKRAETDGSENTQEGRGHVLRDGRDATVVVVGPVLTVEILKAADILAVHGLEIKIIATPWLNRFDTSWYMDEILADRPLFTVENHYRENGFGGNLIASLAETGGLRAGVVQRLGLNEVPASGRNDEVLQYHGLDAANLAEHIRQMSE